MEFLGIEALMQLNVKSLVTQLAGVFTIFALALFIPAGALAWLRSSGRRQGLSRAGLLASEGHYDRIIN